MNLPQSSRGLLEVMMVERSSYLRMIIYKKYFPDCLGSFLSPMSSIMSKFGLRDLWSILARSLKAPVCIN